jgi:adenine-specific DNA-methyltransferase
MSSNAKAPRNVVFDADCLDVMQAFDAGAVDFMLTDPPYVTRCRARDGRTSPTTTTTVGFAPPSSAAF